MSTKSIHVRWRLTILLGVAVLVLLFGSLPALLGSLAAAPQLAQTVVPACGTVTSNTTWTANNVYQLDGCNLIVAEGATLTLQAGTAVQVGGNCGTSGSKNCALVVKGSLQAQGTAVSPVIFTSLNDNRSRGGANTATAGEWYGLHFASGSRGNLLHTQVSYAGSGELGRWDNWIFANRAQIFAQDSTLEIRESRISHGLKAGIALYGPDVDVQIEATHIEHNVGSAEPNLPGAIYQNTQFMTARYRNLTLEANSSDDVGIAWGTGVGTAVLDGGPFRIFNDAGVYDNNTLILRPGTHIGFYTGQGIVVQQGGTLTATGTLAEPIMLTPLESAWKGLILQYGSRGTLSHTEIRGGGSGTWGGSIAALWVASDQVAISDVTIRESAHDGLRLDGWQQNQVALRTTMRNLRIYDNQRDGLVLSTYDGELTLNASEIYANGGDGVRLAMPKGIGGGPPRDQTLTLNNVTIRDNGGLGLDNASVGNQVTLNNSRITNNGGAALRMTADNDTPVLTDTTISGNDFNGMLIGFAGIQHNRHWRIPQAGLPFLVEGSTLSIGSEGALRLEPGVTLNFPQGSSMAVNGQLTAVGTPEAPIRFLGAQRGAGAWHGIHLTPGSSATLQHCEVAYGGRTFWRNFGSLLEIDTTGTVRVEDCAFHASGGHGLWVNSFGTLTFRNNRIEDIDGYGLGYTLEPTLDVRGNWWGHASGPKHVGKNPDGQGNTLWNNDNILFDPWLTASPVQAAEVAVKIASVGGIFPGQLVDYVVSYANHTEGTINDAILIFRLPYLAALEDRGSGTYWPARQVVFWKLGNIAPGASEQFLVRARFQWGIPIGTFDSSSAMLVAANYNQDLLDRTAYQNYSAPAIAEVGQLSLNQWNDLRNTNAELNSLYTQALNAGYIWAGAQQVDLAGDQQSYQAILLHRGERAVRVLQLHGERTQAATYAPNSYRVEDARGGMQWDMLSDERRYWGAWDTINGAAWPGTVVDAQLCAELSGAGCCLSNCLSNVALSAVVGQVSGTLGTIMATYDCAQSLRSDPLSDQLSRCADTIGKRLLGVSGLDNLAGVTECLAQCAGDPNSQSCTNDLVTCEPRWYNIYEWLGVPNRTVWRCRNGCYSTKPEFLPCAFGECCVPGAGCSDSGNGVDCRGNSFIIARDPNEKHGPAGDLLPGQVVPYTIEYENVGEGIAYGVYIIDQLHEHFDDATLVIGNGGEYNATTREISWLIGDLDPVGQPGSTGEVTFTVNLKPNLPGGTIITNQAVVYFPSVPEETPTSVVVHMVQPVVAEPQTLTTKHETPLAISLSAREVSNAAVTYRITTPPLFGTLSGTPPNLTYTPMEGYVGADFFSFVANNGTIDSRPADVRIEVSSEGDTRAPQVVWTLPAADATGVLASRTVVFSDTQGNLYGPQIIAGMSEALDGATVTSSTVQVQSSNGNTIATLAHFDPRGNQIVLMPRQALNAGSYSVTITTGVRDRAGNRLAEAHTWSFTVGAANDGRHSVWLPLVRR
ncbi:right-handed parallel beta-helix repeat-containing protein [Candidatus Viridilinea mediisalina]|uniref:Right handed beta helix domain-containing protein n=1 Tax=Candidatus Viridilinea mediisalina TaxID=2024553 RepID=A0A2A6RKF7_9CHLR|nr:right-handed parallel beta-helix repeat-containing protein [Candidatus Viridilinea mediisalina]PDW03502.1 hypothetical protein CJ255_08445 [Candidatus Viridilinea mediisalina]